MNHHIAHCALVPDFVDCWPFVLSFYLFLLNSMIVICSIKLWSLFRLLYAFEVSFCSLFDNWKRSRNTCHLSYIRTEHSFVGSILLLLLFLLLMLSISIGQLEPRPSSTWTAGLNVSTFRYINTENEKFLFSSPPAH